MARQSTTTTTATDKHPGGRPTKLTPELVKKASGYLRELEMGGLYFGDVPSDWGLAIYLGIGRTTMYEWSKLDNPLALEFQNTLSDVNDKQGYTLFNKGLKGEYNPTLTKMMLSANHGIVETQKIDQNNSGEQKIIVETRRYDAPTEE